jgi:Ala-tRNA(Pro) deacylase
MISENEKKVYDVLDELKISYTCVQHIPVYTIDEVDNLNLDMKGQHCKNLFTRNKQGNQHYLILVSHTKKADLKDVAHQIGCSRLSFASEERLMRHLGLTPGSVTPFGLLNDSAKHVKVLIDRDFKSCDYICFHPNVNTASVCISFKDFEKFLEWCGNSYQYITI